MNPNPKTRWRVRVWRPTDLLPFLVLDCYDRSAAWHHARALRDAGLVTRVSRVFPMPPLPPLRRGAP